MATLNKHGAIFMLCVSDQRGNVSTPEFYGTVEGVMAAFWKANASEASSDIRNARDILSYASKFRDNPIGAIDCAWNVYPICWVDPNHDDYQAEMVDWEDYEKALRAKGGAV